MDAMGMDPPPSRSKGLSSREGVICSVEAAATGRSIPHTLLYDVKLTRGSSRLRWKRSGGKEGAPDSRSGGCNARRCWFSSSNER